MRDTRGRQSAIIDVLVCCELISTNDCVPDPWLSAIQSRPHGIICLNKVQLAPAVVFDKDGHQDCSVVVYLDQCLRLPWPV